MDLTPLKKSIASLAVNRPAIEVVWLYGSAARGDATERSDYDIACAFNHDLAQEQEAEELRFQLQQQSPRAVSVVDINQAPIPLALNIIEDGIVIYCASDLRLHAEESRVWSRWESISREAKRFPNEL